MTDRRQRRDCRWDGRGLALTLLLAVCLLPGICGQPFAASRDARSTAAPMTPTPQPPPARTPTAAAPIIPAEAATGMCQCVADHARRHIGCLSSVEACQSACGGGHYSFVPHAPSCPITAQERGR
jgi:hypothetical protein